MNNIKFKKSFIIILAVIAAVFLCMTFLIIQSNNVKDVNAAEITGELAKPPSGSALVITLDLNGRDNSTDSETATDTFNANDRLKLRKRNISAGLLIDLAFSGDNNTGYYIDAAQSYAIYNPNSSIASITGQMNFGRYTALTFEALKVVPSGYSAYARITFIHDDPTFEDKNVYIQFAVSSTFAHFYDSTNVGGTVIIGNNDNVKNVITLKNNTRVEINLEEKLKGMPLYKSLSADSIVYGDRINESNGTPWTIKDAKNLTLKTAKISSVDEKIIKADVRNATGSSLGLYAPTIYYDVNLTEESLKNVINISKFWKTDYAANDNIFRLNLTFDINGIDMTAVFFVEFEVASKPLLKQSFTMPTELNAGITDDVIFTKSEELKTGFKATRVYAEYLVEYPAASSAISLAENCTNEGKKYVSDESKIDPDTGRVYFEIKGLENGVAFVTFTINYIDPKYPTLNESISVKVAFNVYGKYDFKKVDIGGKVIKESINSVTMFNPLKAEGFILSDAEVKDPTIASVDISKNYIIYTPLKDGITTITYTFTSFEDKEIQVTTILDVNKARGDWWLMLQTWAKVLIIAGGILVAIALILFFIWLFAKGLANARRVENETSVPTSSYIVKLNSTIAAAQAQQKLTATSYNSNIASAQTLQLGAGPTFTQAPVISSTLQLGAAAPYQPTSVAPPPPLMPTYAPPPFEAIAPQPAVINAEDIYIPMSDEALIERIFVEKYEPRGMARRSFFKSRELQTKELEKEKARIRENVKAGMTIEEACKTDKQREQETAASSVVSAPADAEKPVDNMLIILGFDPNAPVIDESADKEEKVSKDKKIVTDENGEQKFIYDETTQEEEDLAFAQKEYDKIIRESVAIKQKSEKAKTEVDRINAEIKALKESNESLNVEIKKAQEAITDLEVKLSVAKGKEKDKYSKDILALEERLKDMKTKVSTNESTLVEKEEMYDKLFKIVELFSEKSEENSQAIISTEQALKVAENKAKVAQDRAQKAKEKQTLDRQAAMLSPMLESVAKCDIAMRSLTEEIEKNVQLKTELKSEVSALQNQLLSTSNPQAVNNIGEAIKEKNKKITEIDKAITACTKTKSDKGIELASNRKKANEFIEKENIEAAKVITIEDSVLNRLLHEEMIKTAEKDKEIAENLLNSNQALYNMLVDNQDVNLAQAAAKSAEEMKVVEDEIFTLQQELLDLNIRMDEASDDDKLMMSLDQMALNEKIEQLNQTLDEMRANGIKSNLEYKLKSDEEIKEANNSLEQAKADYENASERISRLLNLTVIPDIATKGSGLVSQDRQAIESSNLKIQLEKSHNAIEQAKLQAKMAQMEAEQAIIDAQRASKASKEEAERLAKEAIEKAEQARLEAEEKAKEEIDKVKQEAAEEAEKARRDAESEAGKARRDAEEEAARVRKEILDEQEKARLAAEASEEAKKANEAKKAEEEARLTAKITKRKQEIAEMRRGIKIIDSEAAGNDLKEKFFNLQLHFDEDEKSSQELRELIERSMSDSLHAGEVARYKAIAAQQPKRIVKKVTERVNKIQRPRPAGTGARPASSSSGIAARPAGTSTTRTSTVRSTSVSRPAAQGARPAGARPAGAGVRPASGSSGARPAGARPAPRPDGTRPAGSVTRSTVRTTTSTTRPAGARPAARPEGTRPAGTGVRPAGERPSGTAVRRPPQN